MTNNCESVERFLGGLPLFAGLKPAEISRLALGATERNAPHGTVVFRQGEPCQSLHVVASGQVKLSLHTARGSEKVVELARPGRILGETSLILNEAYLLTAEAINDARLIVLGKDVLLRQVMHNLNFLQCMLQDVCLHLHQRTRDLESFLIHNGTQRVTDYLLSQLPPHNGTPLKHAAVTLPAKKSIIASRLNLTHEHFSRILHDIQAAGLIEVRGRQIRLTDPARLRTAFGLESGITSRECQ